MKLRLSRLVPVRFTSLYGVESTRGSGRFNAAEHVTWLQFRGRILRHRVTRVVLPA